MADEEEVFLIDEDEAGEIVHWQERPRLHLSAYQATGATLAAFGLGMLAAVGALALLGKIRD
jgi:hypothetical protein